jgi:hypothetical protein
MPPKRRRSPGPRARATSTTPIAANHSNGHRRQDGYAAPSAEDRADTAVLAAAEALGYRLAVQCLDCGHWLANPASVTAHRGPVCRAKVPL